MRVVAEASIQDGEDLIVQEDGGWRLRYRHGERIRQASFDTSEELFRKLGDDEDLRLGFYREWVDPKVDSLDVNLFISLDLSTQTDELGIWNSNTSFYYKRYFAPFGKNFMGYSRKVSRELGYSFRDVLVNGISPEGGKSWETFVPGEISVNSELVLTTGTPALAFVTVNDARFLVDTPLDRARNIRYDNLSRQIRALAGMFHMAFEDPELFPDFKMRLKDTMRSLKARTMVFPRRSIVPDLPRTEAVGVVRNGKKKSYKGVRGEYFEVVDDDGAFYVNRIRVEQVQVEGYYMDPATGRISYAPDRGIQGDQSYPMLIKMDWRDKEWMVVLFPCQAFNFYDIVDPRYLTKLSEVTVFDETNASPVEYGYTIGEGPSAKDEAVGVLFARPGAFVKMGFGAGILGFRSLLLNSENPDDKEEALGAGFAMEPGELLRAHLLPVGQGHVDPRRGAHARAAGVRHREPAPERPPRARPGGAGTGGDGPGAQGVERVRAPHALRHRPRVEGLPRRQVDPERRHPGHHLLHGPGPSLCLLRRAPADHGGHDTAPDHGLRRHLPRHLGRPLHRPPRLRAVQPLRHSPGLRHPRPRQPRHVDHLGPLQRADEEAAHRGGRHSRHGREPLQRLPHRLPPGHLEHGGAASCARR